MRQRWPDRRTPPSSSTTDAPTSAAAAAPPGSTPPPVKFTQDAPQPPAGAMLANRRDATGQFASVGTASSVDELTQGIVSQLTSGPEPSPLTVSVQEVAKGLEYQVTVRAYGLQDDSLGAFDFTIVVRPAPGGWAASSASAGAPRPSAERR